MLHTLRTLYDFAAKHYPEFVDYLPRLRDYCYHTKYDQTGSLRWFMYKIRNRFPQREVQSIFIALLQEASLKNTTDIFYHDVMSLRIAQKYAQIIQAPKSK